MRSAERRRWRRSGSTASVPGSARMSRVESLSPADRQLVEIARAVGPGAKYLFFDEPTSALGPAETERLFELIRRLRDDGTAVVYVSHRLEEVFAICERVVVMRDGHIVADEPVESLDEDRLVGLMAGQELAADLTTEHARRQLPDGSAIPHGRRGPAGGSTPRRLTRRSARAEIHGSRGSSGPVVPRCSRSSLASSDRLPVR